MMAVTVRGVASSCQVAVPMYAHTPFRASKVVTSMGNDDGESECRRHAGSTLQRGACAAEDAGTKETVTRKCRHSPAFQDI